MIFEIKIKKILELYESSANNKKSEILLGIHNILINQYPIEYKILLNKYSIDKELDSQRKICQKIFLLIDSYHIDTDKMIIALSKNNQIVIESKFYNIYNLIEQFKINNAAEKLVIISLFSQESYFTSFQLYSLFKEINLNLKN